MSERPRDLALERKLTDIAAKAAGHADDGGLGAFADQRAYTGPVYLTRRDNGEPRDWRQEVLEELADARNYCVWGIEEIYALVLAGDSDATAAYARLMRALAGVVQAWHALR